MRTATNYRKANYLFNKYWWDQKKFTKTNVNTFNTLVSETEKKMKEHLYHDVKLTSRQFNNLVNTAMQLIMIYDTFDESKDLVKSIRDTEYLDSVDYDLRGLNRKMLGIE